MGSTGLLDGILNAGRDYAERGARQAEDLAADRMGVGDSEPERGALSKGLAGGALAAGALALILGTGGGRRLAGSALKVGAAAALGGLAYKAYKNWAGSGSDPAAAQARAPEELAPPIGELQGAEADRRSHILLAAMVAAAKADGHIDGSEMRRIEGEMDRLGLDADDLSLLREELSRPADPAAIAAKADDPQIAIEIYAISSLVIDRSDPRERAYLDELANNLRLAPGLAEHIERELSDGAA